MSTDRNHDMSRDEIRRQLREASAEQDAAMPGWRRSLDRALDPDSGATAADKAALLGVPTRRTFVFGGALLTGGALLAACGKKKNDQTPVTGALPTVPSTTTTTAPGSAATDLVLLRTAQSIEILAVDTYQQALDSGLLTDAPVISAVQLFQDQHEEHSAALSTAIRDAGGTPVSEGNQYLKESAVDKAVSELTDQTSVLELARELENIAAQTYVMAAGTFTTPALRKSGMSVGDIEARHITVINMALGYSPVPLPFIPTGKAIDPKGYIKS